jgi:hypothetical protein
MLPIDLIQIIVKFIRVVLKYLDRVCKGKTDVSGEDLRNQLQFTLGTRKFNEFSSYTGQLSKNQ